jgi:hypothetical protein
MNKLKIFALTAVTAATVCVGSLVAPQSASAMPLSCEAYEMRALTYESLEMVAEASGDYALATGYNFWAQVYYSLMKKCYGG